MVKIFYSYLRSIAFFGVVILLLFIPLQTHKPYLENNLEPITIKLIPYKSLERQLIGYFTSWNIYNKETPYNVKHVVDSGAAQRLTVINYAFAKVTDSACELGDPWGDYEKPFGEESSVDGFADLAKQELKGNFNQFKKLKELYPDIKLIIVLGGWTWSEHFSDIALTVETRKSFVSSCIDLFIKGNLPEREEGIATGVFDGIEVDWEYPGAPGHPNNTLP